MSKKMTGPALIAYLRQFPTSDDRQWAADEIERLQSINSMLINSVCRELEKHGIEEVDSPAEAIEVLVADKNAQIERLHEALKMIAAWEPPHVLSQGETVPMSVAIGSNGERDHFRGIARAALAQGEP